MRSEQFDCTLLPRPEVMYEGQAWHVDSEIAAVAVLYLPCEQGLQAAGPFASLKLPTPHGSHSTPSGPVYPALQEQLDNTLLPRLEDM